MKHLPPGIALLLLGPLFGELISGHQTLFQFINPLNFILSALPYGCGAVLCRELVVRWGKGWFALVLLGIAFGIYEEAIVARSFWDPEWAELGALRDYSYWQGVTWIYAEVLIHFHLTISILCSVVLAEIIYADRRNETWVSNRGLIACGVGLLLWMPALMLINPYMPPLGGFVLSWLAIAGLVYAAWRLPNQVFPQRDGKSVHPFWYALIAAVNMTLVFVSVFVLPELNPAWLPAWPAVFVFVALLDALTFWIIMRWSGNATAWDDRHKLALVIGLTAFFILMDFLKDLESDFTGLSIVALITIWGFYKTWLHVKHRAGTCPQPL
ncbi:hypothetical protein [Gimesia fumaroli]|uniref:Uncharacterized protein n=1 Tax=Gimesia fumaroli TaxID=2527976 RepID=A0A518I4X2_9PLAN|nr:hypothetical protein [Gimesia fumaroli]QDV48103.1 hypothetical protein Enr17x_01120 [Gimesia fumaroli]